MLKQKLHVKSLLLMISHWNLFESKNLIFLLFSYLSSVNSLAIPFSLINSNDCSKSNQNSRLVDKPETTSNGNSTRKMEILWWFLWCGKNTPGFRQSTHFKSGNHQKGTDPNASYIAFWVPVRVYLWLSCITFEVNTIPNEIFSSLWYSS